MTPQDMLTNIKVSTHDGTSLWRVIRVKIKRANFSQYEYLNSCFISHYFLIPIFFKPLLPNCMSATELIANKVLIYKPC